MKKIHRVFALLLAMIMALGLITTALAAPTIDLGRKASLSVYKYDITAASADGVWDAASYVSTGVQDDAVTDKLAQYAIQGVEFTYLRVASISTYSQRESGQHKVGVLYGFADDAVLQAIGLGKADAYKSGNGVFYFTSDKLNKALADALADNATTVKNALEAAVRNGGKAMAETDANGHSKVSGLEQGLYLVVETRVPENVTSTCNPFFVSLPMTTIDGKSWNYDVTVYPKNQTGNPTLEKTVREAAADTGKNGGTAGIADGYAHTATASVDDVVEYQVLSKLPTITSKATSLTTYTFVDTLSEGIRYNKNDVVIEFFRDAGCTDKITTWDENSGKFRVSYDDAANTMTIGMTEAGLADINGAAAVYDPAVSLVRGYSDCFLRITYVVGTSLPVGGSGTHAVLSAHSGMASAKLFSDIDRLAEGDTFYIHVLGEVLAYEVDQIATVLPSDTSLLQIEDGQDLVTLVTCTPFGVNTHRLLVRGHRVPYVAELVAEGGATQKAASSWTRHYLAGLGIGIGVLVVAGGGCFLVRRKRRG